MNTINYHKYNLLGFYKIFYIFLLIYNICIIVFVFYSYYKCNTLLKYLSALSIYICVCLVLCNLFIYSKTKKIKMICLNVRISSVLYSLLIISPLITYRIVYAKYTININEAIFFIQIILMATLEEIVFRYYIQFNLNMQFNKKCSIIIGCLIFYLNHLPLYIINQFSIPYLLIKFLVLSILHIFYYTILKHQNCIVSPILTHALINFCPT
jgi:membrane protease YdiL (CAAX protease family)